MLRLLAAGVEDVMGDQLVGLYLTGSLSYGGFDPGSSDIDLLALLERPITSDQRSALRTLHEQIASKAPEWATRLEISYLPRHLLDSKEPPAEPRPYVNGGQLWEPDPVWPRMDDESVRLAALRASHCAALPLGSLPGGRQRRHAGRLASVAARGVGAAAR